MSLREAWFSHCSAQFAIKIDHALGWRLKVRKYDMKIPTSAKIPTYIDKQQKFYTHYLNVILITRSVRFDVSCWCWHVVIRYLHALATYWFIEETIGVGERSLQSSSLFRQRQFWAVQTLQTDKSNWSFKKNYH
jgi:hypothetical protein